MLLAAYEAQHLTDLYASGTRYLRLLIWTGNPALAAGQLPSKGGVMPSGLTEPTTGGYAPIAVAGSAWGTPVEGLSSPTTIQVPKVGGANIGWTPTATWSNIVGYAWTTTSAAISAANLVSASSFVDLDNLDPDTGQPIPLAFDQPAGTFLGWGDGTGPVLVPLVERTGGAPPGVNPS